MSVYCDRLLYNREESGGVVKRGAGKLVIASLVYAFNTLNIWMVSGGASESRVYI